MEWRYENFTLHLGDTYNCGCQFSGVERTEITIHFSIIDTETPSQEKTCMKYTFNFAIIKYFSSHIALIRETF